MEKNKTILEKFFSLNWTLITLIILMSSIGFVMLYSAAEGNFYPWASKQMTRFLIFFPFMILIALIDIKYWFKLSYVIYCICLILLVLTFEYGVQVMGAQRWLRIGPVNIQPSEIMKICVVFALARYFHNISYNNINNLYYIIPPLIIIAIPALLVQQQPDLGTAIIILAIGGAMMFAAGINIWFFVSIVIAGLLSIPLIFKYILHDYQKDRVLAFLNPENDPLGNGYNILQSIIAIGSGGFSGKGFLQGTQSQLSFLPEKQTDFIFTMLAEEFGLIGGVSVILIYMMIMGYGFFIALNSKSHYGKLIAIGITAMIFIHLFINTAMVMGMIPVVGAPLPLLSYGGTIMLTILIAFGLLLNVHVHSNTSLEKDKFS